MDYDNTTDFAKYKTYQWFPGNIEGDFLTANPLIKKRVMFSVEKAMLEKKLRIVENDADLVAVVYAGSKERKQITTMNTGMGMGGPGWHRRGWHGGGMHTTDVSYYEDGTLIIDLIDAPSGELVWRGMGTKTLESNPSREKQESNIDNVVKKIMDEFPPK